jgi:hypothetical protein
LLPLSSLDRINISVIKPVIMFNEVSVLDGDLNPLTAIAVQRSISRSTRSLRKSGSMITPHI